MGTSNFSRTVNVDKIYAALMAQNGTNPEEWEIEDFKGDLRNLLSEIGGDDCDERLGSNKINISQIGVAKDYGDVEIVVIFKVFMEYGYHEGARLDYTIDICDHSGGEWEYSTGSCYDMDLDEILDEVFTEDYSDMSAGLRSILKGHAKRYVENLEVAMNEQLQKIFDLVSSDKMVRVGTFSNGVSVYEKA